VLHSVTHCYTVLHSVTQCYTVLHSVTHCRCIRISSNIAPRNMIKFCPYVFFLSLLCPFLFQLSERKIKLLASNSRGKNKNKNKKWGADTFNRLQYKLPFLHQAYIANIPRRKHWSWFLSSTRFRRYSQTCHYFASIWHPSQMDENSDCNNDTKHRRCKLHTVLGQRIVLDRVLNEGD